MSHVDWKKHGSAQKDPIQTALVLLCLVVAGGLLVAVMALG